MSELEVTSFYGFGNATPDAPLEQAEVKQKQWQLYPAIALSLGARSDISFGPVIQYSTTADVPGRIISTQQPYGFGEFGQAGIRLGLFHDGRDAVKDPRRGVLLDLSGAVYPAVWDVESAFGSVAASAALYYTFHLPLRPILLIRGSGRKLFGDFPFHEAAFVGGRGSVRRLDRQRFAGDASIGGTAELQIPVARFALILPLDVGIYGYADAGKVFVDGESPGGWHKGAGFGAWVAIMNPATSIAFELGEQRGRSVVRVKTGLAF
jgi:outer membrane protein assembly factor BamA